MLPGFSYLRPESLAEAIENLTADGAVAHAGGTDLLGCLRDGVHSARKVVSLSRIEELRGIRETGDGGLRIGAMATLSEVAVHPAIRSRFPALARAAAEAASPQLRNQGTLGGNLCQKPRCWYYRGEFHCLRKGGDRCYAVGGDNRYHCLFGGYGCYIVHPSDTAPALVALEATVRIAGSEGIRSLPVGEFFVAPSKDPRRETALEKGQLLTEVFVPPPAPGLRTSFRKVRARGAWDFALAGAALALHMEGEKVRSARVVLAGAAPIPWRAKAAEQALDGQEVARESAAAAAEAAVETAEPLEHNRYKIPLFRGLLEEEVLKLAAAGT